MMKKYRYNIINLDCANCARNIEEKLNKNKNLKNVVVNFSTGKISYESADVDLKKINRLVREIESEAKVVDSIEKSKPEYHLSILAFVLVLEIGCMFNIGDMAKEVLMIIAYGLLLYRPLYNAIIMLYKNKTINENMLISISCIGAYLINQKMEGLMVVTLYVIGKLLEEKAINNSKKAINDIVNIKQDYANLVTDKGLIKVNVETIKVGDILVIKKGEKIPVDGMIIGGKTKLDMAALTGESAAVMVKEEDNVLSGSINLEDIIKIRAIKKYDDSTVAKILDLVMNATDKKAKTETIVAKLSKIYTPVVLGLAVLVTLLLPLWKISFQDSLYRGLTFLVISCPCAIAISVPLSYFTGIGVASKNGILIKGSNYLDNLSKIKMMVFDKTGTLTNGSFQVKNVIVEDKKYTKDNVLKIMAMGESLSNHPLAKAIVATQKHIDNKEIKNFKEDSGSGISFVWQDKEVKIGSKDVCNCGQEGRIHLNIDGKHIATIEIDDGIKEEAGTVIKELKNNQIIPWMFTGDKKAMAKMVSQEIGIDNVRDEMLPEDKYQALEELKKGGMVAFVGDGINDAPVLKLADVGIAMGEIGQSSAIEASDIVIMTDNLKKITKAIKISQVTRQIIKENLIFALGTKIIILILSVFGLATMWFAVFADTGVTLLTILNTLRIISKNKIDK